MDSLVREAAVTAAVLMFVGWRSHYKAVRRAEEEGDEPPGALDLAWSLFKPLAALGIGCVAGFAFLRAELQPGAGWEGLFAFAGAYIAAFIAFGFAWGALAVLGMGGHLVRLVLAAGVAMVLSVGLVQPILGARKPPQERAEAEAQAKAERRKISIPHGPTGVVPGYVKVVEEGDSLSITNRTEQALYVTVARVLAKDGGRERCVLRAEGNKKAPAEVEVPYAGTVTIVSHCAPGFADAPLEFRISIASGKIIYMSDSAFLP